MKKTILMMAAAGSLALGVSSAFADIKGPVILHFNTDKIASRVESMKINYQYHSGNAWGESSINPMTQSELNLSTLAADAKTSLQVSGTVKQGGGDPIFVSTNNYNMLLPPKHALCHLNDMLSGSHEVTFSFEPAYFATAPHAQAGDYLLCDIS